MNIAAYTVDVFYKTAKTINKLSSFDDLAYANFENKGGGGGKEVNSSYFSKS